MKNIIKSTVNSVICLLCWFALQDFTYESLAGIVCWLVILTTFNTCIDIFVEVLKKIRGRKSGM